MGNDICALFYAKQTIKNFLFGVAHRVFNLSHPVRVQVERLAIKDVNLSTFEMSLNQDFSICLRNTCKTSKRNIYVYNVSLADGAKNANISSDASLIKYRFEVLKQKSVEFY